jgi:hypothetical protein
VACPLLVIVNDKHKFKKDSKVKYLFDSYFYKISNFLGRNHPILPDKNDIETEPDEVLFNMSYNDYIQYINNEKSKKASPLQPDFYSM